MPTMLNAFSLLCMSTHRSESTQDLGTNGPEHKQRMIAEPPRDNLGG